jgi:hypothetical protein
VATSASIESLGGAAGQVIADVGGGAFIVSVGSGQGIKVGDRLTVFAEQVTRNKQGQVVYREEQRIATLEVVDVSMADRARAKLVSDGAVQPKEGDRVRIDVARATALRGAPASTGAVDSSAEMQRLVKQGDRYMEDEYFSQAVDAYQKALVLQPMSAVVLGKLASAFISNRRIGDAEELIDRLFPAGGELSFSIGHRHGSFSLGAECVGRIVLSRGGFSYRPEKGNHGLELQPDKIVDIAFTGGTLSRVSLRFLDERSREQTYEFWAPGDAALYRDDPQLAEDTGRMYRMLVRVVQQKLLGRLRS